MENQENEILYKGGKANERFDVADFTKSQMKDETKAKLIQLKREGIALTASEKKQRVQRSKDVFERFRKIDCSGHGVLYRHVTGKQQLVLLIKVIPPIFTELHVKMEHLCQ